MKPSIIETKLAELGYTLPFAGVPIGNYLGCKKAGEILFAAARVSACVGEVGTEVSIDKAKEAARDTVLMILAIIKEDIKDLDQITGVIKMTGFVRSSADFTEQPKVIDGASDLLIELFGENGRHAKTATGVVQLPGGASVQLDIIFHIEQQRHYDTK